MLLTLPSSKSLANRVFVLSALSRGNFRIFGDFEAEDVQLMMSSLKSLGICIEVEDGGVLIKNDLTWRDRSDDIDLYLGNSGTCSRFLSVLCSLREGNTRIYGKQRLHERPFVDLHAALNQLGVQIDYEDREGYAPFTLYGQGSLAGGDVQMSAAESSQYVTAVLLCAAVFDNGVDIQLIDTVISQPYIDMTLDFLMRWGIDAQWTSDTSLHVSPAELRGEDLTVEGDASAATYWWAYGYLHDLSVSFSNLDDSSVQGDLKFQQILKQLKAFDGDYFEIDMNDLPDASLTLMAMVPVLPFSVKISNIASLRVKETDRIHAMSTELHKIGCKVEAGNDWIFIEPLRGDLDKDIDIQTYDDHRIAMSFAILNTKLKRLNILDPDCVKKTYPKFWEDLKKMEAGC